MTGAALRRVAVVALLVVATVVLWWLVFPADWSAVPTADPITYASPVTAGHWVAAAVGFAVLAAVGGYAQGVPAALVGVALPAVALFCVRSGTAEVIGANMWVIGALLFAPVLAAGVAAAAALGRWVRLRTTRPTPSQPS